MERLEIKELNVEIKNRKILKPTKNESAETTVDAVKDSNAKK